MMNDALCPGCERFVGAEGVCRYCGEETMRLPLWRRLRVAALLLAVVGLGLLYVVARHKPIPTVRIGDITPTMNFAYVCVAGTVESRPYVSKGGTRVDYAAFTIDDGSGTIRVAAYGRVAQQLAALERLPAKGDSVSVSGSLGVPADGRVKLHLRSAGQIRVQPKGE